MVIQIINKLKIMKKDINRIISRLDGARGCIKYTNKQESLILDDFTKEITYMDYDELKEDSKCTYCSDDCWRCDAQINPCSVQMTYVKDAPRTFMWAVEQMKQGKKVRIKSWLNNKYLYKCLDEKSDKLGELLNELDIKNDFIMVVWFEATDWEIYEDNKFGNWEVAESKLIKKSFGLFSENHDIWINEDEFDDLERAIKRARELK